MGVHPIQGYKGDIKMSDEVKSDNGGFGVNMWWTVPEVIRDGKEAQNVLLSNGFDKDDIELPSRRAEISRAVYSFQNRRSKDNRRVTEKAADNLDHVTFGILDREQQGEDVKFVQQTVVKMSKADGSVQASGRLANEVLQAIQSYEGKITDDDIRSFLRRLVKKCHGVAKRPSGGIYFIPSNYVEKIKSAQLVLDGIRSGAKLYVEGIINGTQERQNVWNSVEEEIEASLEKTLAAVGCIGRRASAIENHEQDIEQARELMEVYKGLLGQEAKYEALTEKIEEAVKVVSQKMAELQAGKAAALMKPKQKRAA